MSNSIKRIVLFTRLALAFFWIIVLSAMPSHGLNETIIEDDHHQRQSSFDHLYQGDMRIDQRFESGSNNRRLQSSAIRKWTTQPKNGFFWIQVYIDKNQYSPNEQGIIINALRRMQYTAKVIKFQTIDPNIQSTSKPYIHIKKDNGCWSWLGRKNASGGQTLSLGNGCVNQRAVHHLMMHALGVGHEHTRMDRDSYITVNRNNIKSGFEEEFYRVSNIPTYGVPYDYKSVMHFGEYTFSGNGGKTLQSKNHNKPISYSRNKASWFDYMTLRMMYQCSNGSSRTWQSYKNNKCTAQCPCWRKSGQCGRSNQNCKGRLICRNNVCVDP